MSLLYESPGVGINVGRPRMQLKMVESDQKRSSSLEPKELPASTSQDNRLMETNRPLDPLFDLWVVNSNQTKESQDNRWIKERIIWDLDI